MRPSTPLPCDGLRQARKDYDPKDAAWLCEEAVQSDTALPQNTLGNQESLRMIRDRFPGRIVATACLWRRESIRDDARNFAQTRHNGGWCGVVQQTWQCMASGDTSSPWPYIRRFVAFLCGPGTAQERPEWCCATATAPSALGDKVKLQNRMSARTSDWKEDCV